MPSSSMILKLSELFDVTTDYLLGKDNQIEKKSFISNKREVKKSPPSIEDRLNKLTDEQLELVEALSLLDAKTREIALEQIRVLLDHKQKNNQ